jgi:sialate O-acetylesterase
MKHLIATGVAGALVVSTVAHGAIDLPAIISDNMVLQRSARTPIWGRGAAGEKVSVSVADVTADATADAAGHWRVDLDLRIVPEDGPFDMVIKASDTITIRNVVIGEVWLCSGQSNMEWTVQNTNDFPNESAAADLPMIRHFQVQKRIAPEPTKELAGQWVVASPATVGGFTAVGYYFGREIHRKIGKPVGLINSSWGGTYAEAWTSDDQLAGDEHYAKAIELRQLGFSDAPRAEAIFAQANADWEDKYLPKDEKNEGFENGWASADSATTDWKTMRLPKLWQNAGIHHNGVIWFRKDVQVSSDAAGKPATLNLGPIDDGEITYVNGTKVGQTQGWNVPRTYELPAGTLRAGQNVIAVRVWDEGGNGGIYGAPEQMSLTFKDGEPVSLAGDWLYRIEREFTVDASKLPPRPQEPATRNPNQPAVLYNGMIAPIIPYGIRGAIWYQGESNAGNHLRYRDLMSRLIEGWRKDFDRGEFPFYIVQLANFMARQAEPTDTAWARMRDVQRQIAETVPNTGLAVTIDIGEEKDIHPRNKQDVGKRLAAIAIARDYGQLVEYSGPRYAGHTTEGDKLRVTFKHGKGLTAKGGKLEGFAIAGADGKFVWADGAIDGDSVILTAPGVTAPTMVRYAWADNPAATLYNAAGFPAVPFEGK